MIQDDLRKINHVLKQLWLIESEVEIFLLWLETGAATIQQFADQTRMNRITVHEIIRRLIKKWLFLETYSGKKRLVYPNQVDALDQLLDTKRAELNRLETASKQASSILRSIQTQAENFPKTRFYKGHEGVQRMISEIKKDKEDIAIMSDGQHFYELIDNDFLEKTLDLRQKKKLHVQLLFPPGFEYFTYTQWTYQQQLDIKALPQEELLKGGMTIRWNKVALHCYEWKFITTTIIENPPIANMTRYFFSIIWWVAKEY